MMLFLHFRNVSLCAWIGIWTHLMWFPELTQQESEKKA